MAKCGRLQTSTRRVYLRLLPQRRPLLSALCFQGQLDRVRRRRLGWRDGRVDVVGAELPRSEAAHAPAALAAFSGLWRAAQKKEGKDPATDNGEAFLFCDLRHGFRFGQTSNFPDVCGRIWW